jgi:excisionase family DNA binding protein
MAGGSMQITIDLMPITDRLDRIEAQLDAISTQELAEQVLDAKEAASFLDISISHLYRLTSERRIRYSKPNGGRIYFKRTDLEAYATSARVSTRDEIRSLAKKWMDAHSSGGRTGR